MKKILIEAYFYLAWGRILKRLPFSKVAPSLGQPMVETSLSISYEFRSILVKVHRAIYLMSKYTFWESECLVKAFAAMKMLERRNIDCTLYLGMAKDKSGNLLAHAWTRSGPFYVTGGESMERFTVVQKFAKTVMKERGNLNEKGLYP